MMLAIFRSQQDILHTQTVDNTRKANATNIICLVDMASLATVS